MTAPDTEISADDADALLTRLRVIEQQELDDRASGYAAVHDLLQHRLDGSRSAG